MTEDDARTLIAESLRGIAPEADLSTVPGDASMAEELDLDSMDLMNLFAVLHDRTGLELPEADYGELSTLDGAIRYLVAHSAGS